VNSVSKLQRATSHAPASTDGRDSLRVLVNGMSARLGGGETLFIAQMESLSLLDGVELTIYATPSVAARLQGSCPDATIHSRRIRSLTGRLLWEQFVLPRVVRKHDVLYSPGNFAVLAAPRPQVVAFQNALHFGKAGARFVRGVHSGRYRTRTWVERRLARVSLRRASAAVVLSKSLGRAIAEDIDRAPNLRVVEGAPIPPRGLAQELATDRELRLPDLGVPYALAIAHDYFHKDWDGLIEAFLRHPDLPPLLLVGQCRTESRLEDLRETILKSGATGRIHLLGPALDDGTLHHLYRGASCYVAHSYLEAFPLTPREAIVYGLPVAASDIPAHRELDGAPVQFYPPDDLETLAEAVRSALRMSIETEPRPLAGRTWEDNAKELIEVFRAVSSERLSRVS
jgi:glycosyltransferase involved in cell wall biosynthesis